MTTKNSNRQKPIQAGIATFCLGILMNTALPVITSQTPFAQASFAQTTSETSINAAEDMLAWMQEASGIYTDLVSLFDTDLMAEAYAAMDAEDTDALIRIGNQMDALKQEALPKIDRRIATLPPPERWNIDPSLFDREEKAMFEAAKEAYDGFGETRDMVVSITGDLIEMFVNIETIEEDALLALIETQSKAGFALIENENRQLKSFMAAVPSDNPNHQFHDIMIRTNDAILAEMSMPLEPSLAERKSVGRRMQRLAMPVESLIRRGNRNHTRVMGEFHDLYKTDLTLQETTFLDKMIPAMETFTEQFAIEKDILDVILSSAKLYQSDLSDAEIQPEIDANDLAFYRLIDQRLAVSTKRINMSQ